MPATPTTRLSIPLPSQTDPADVPTDLGKLANKLDPIAAVFVQGVASARPAAGTLGRLYYATDTATLYWDTGTAWVTVVSPTIAARGYRNAAAQMPANGTYKIPLDTVSFDSTGGGMSVSQGRFNVPSAGYYQVNGNFTLNQTTSPNGGIALIYQNGVLASQGNRTQTTQLAGAVGCQVSDVIACQAGDYLELYANNLGGLNALAVGPTTNYLSVARI